VLSSECRAFLMSLGLRAGSMTVHSNTLTAVERMVSFLDTEVINLLLIVLTTLWGRDSNQYVDDSFADTHETEWPLN
jgi:hypothetical protein